MFECTDGCGAEPFGRPRQCRYVNNKLYFVLVPPAEVYQNSLRDGEESFAALLHVESKKQNATTEPKKQVNGFVSILIIAAWLHLTHKDQSSHKFSKLV